MWLVLCHPFDSSARWVAEGLYRRGLAPLRMLHGEELAQWCRWEHRIGTTGASFRLLLADGTPLDDGCVRGVLNRLDGLLPGPLAAAEDRPYVAAELRALYWSWLVGLAAPVADPPGPCGFGGPCHLTEWLVLAAGAGLQAPAYRVTCAGEVCDAGPSGHLATVPEGAPRRTVLVVDGRVFHGGASSGAEVQAHEADDAALGAACVRLAAAAGLKVLGVELTMSDTATDAAWADTAADAAGRWTFAGASAAPDLRPGGEPLLDALAGLLRREVAS